MGGRWLLGLGLEADLEAIDCCFGGEPGSKGAAAKARFKVYLVVGV